MGARSNSPIFWDSSSSTSSNFTVEDLRGMMRSAGAVARGDNLTEGEKLVILLQAKNPYAANILMDYLEWARRVAENNGVHWSAIRVEELVDGS